MCFSLYSFINWTHFASHLFISYVFFLFCWSIRLIYRLIAVISCIIIWFSAFLCYHSICPCCSFMRLFVTILVVCLLSTTVFLSFTLCLLVDLWLRSSILIFWILCYLCLWEWLYVYCLSFIYSFIVLCTCFWCCYITVKKSIASLTVTYYYTHTLSSFPIIISYSAHTHSISLNT